MEYQSSTKDKRRKAIINAAFQIFVEKKIEPVSMGEVAEAAGVGRATLFRYYPNKLELVIAVCAAKWKEYLEDENGSLIKVEDEDGSWHWAFIPRDTTILAPRQNEIINREDVILTDGHPGNYDDEENELFPTINNKYNIFNDNTFRDSYATLKVYTPLYQEYYPVEGHYYDHISRKQTITVRLLSITEAEYRYLKALNCLDDGDYDDALMEPISLPCNVIGGLGFVGVCSESRVIIELPETVWR